MKKHIILNEFDKKSIVSSLKDFNVINLILDVGAFDECYYLIYFKYNDVLYSIRDFYSVHWNQSNDIKQNFIQRCNHRLKEFISESEKTVGICGPFRKKYIINFSEYLSNKFFQTLLNASRIQLIDKHPEYWNVTDIYDCVISNLDKKIDFPNTQVDIFNELGVNLDVFIEDIKKHKHKLEK